MRHAKKAISALLLSCMVVLTLAQQRPVTGTILTTTGTPLMCATVNVKGANRSVPSDEKGRYSISAKTGEILVVSNAFQVKTTKVYRLNF